MNSQRSALNIIKRLKSHGFIAYLAGGCVRDMLLGIEPQDFDIATDASVEEIVSLFDKTITVGARFGVVLVLFEGSSVEVTTFRQDISYTDGRKPDSICKASPQEDAERRDFTINGLFYDPDAKEIIDYVGGQEDLGKRLLRAIGDPHKRFFEDRLRMLRAVRFCCRFDLKLEEETEKAIKESAPLLFPAVSVERAWQEMEKMRPTAKCAFHRLYELGLLSVLFPKSCFFLKAIDSFDKFPEKAPLSFYLAKLLLDEPLSTWLELAKTYKCSNAVIKEFEIFDLAHQLTITSSLYDWALYFSEDPELLAMQALGNPIPPIQTLKRSLDDEIKRLKNKKPLLTAAHLLKEGIKPGPSMGQLLKTAEILSINCRIRSPEDLLRKLKSHPLWKSLFEKDLHN